MGMDLNYATSRLLTEEEKDMLLNGELMFRDGYSLELITKAEAETIKNDILYNFMINNITLEELNDNIENIETDLEKYLLEQFCDYEELPMTLKEREDRYCDGYEIIKIEEYEYNNENLYIVIDVRYW